LGGQSWVDTALLKRLINLLAQPLEGV